MSKKKRKERAIVKENMGGVALDDLLSGIDHSKHNFVFFRHREQMEKKTE